MHNLWSVDFSFFYRPIRKNLYGNITATNFTYMQIFKSASKYSNKLLKIIFIKQCTIWFPIQTLYRKKTRTKFMHILTCVKSIKCEKSSFKNKVPGLPWVAQWLRIRLPMQGTRARALVREDPTCRGATKPVRHNYWACTLEPASHNYWVRMLQILKPTRLEPVLCNEKPPQGEALTPPWRVASARQN